MKRKIALLASIAIFTSVACAAPTSEPSSSTSSHLEDRGAMVDDATEVAPVYQEYGETSLEIPDEETLVAGPAASNASATCKVVLQIVKKVAMCTIVCANLSGAAMPGSGLQPTAQALANVAKIKRKCEEDAQKLNSKVAGAARPAPPVSEINIDWSGFWEAVTAFGAGVALIWDATTGWTRAF